MKRIILILLAVFSCYTVNCQKDTTDLIYKSIRQVYRGAYTKSALMTDSQYYETTKSSFRYNKPIYVQGKLLGGETLGNPSVSGMLLKSTTAGVRSWGWPAYVRNYNLTDTFSVLRTVPSGKIGNYTRSVSGYYDRFDSINSGGYVGYVGTNSGGYVGYVGANNYGSHVGFVGANNSGGYVGRVNTNYGNVWGVSTNNSGGYVGYVDTNSGGYVWLVSTNNSGGYVGYVNTNSNGYVGFVGANNSGGYVGRVNTNNYGSYVGFVGENLGICNTVKNVKSTTGGAHSIISAQVYYNNIQKWYRDSIGLSHGEIPSATGFDTTVNLSVNLTADVWQKVTNSTNNLWSLSNTASYMTFSADTIKNTYAGKYEYTFNLSANGKDGATYEYRVMKKTGTTVSVIRKIKITGGGINTERIINCAPLLAAGDKVWVEIRFIGSPTGSPISIFGSYFTAKAVYLSL